MRSRALAMRWRWTLHRMDARAVRGCWARGRTRTGRGSMRWIPGRRGSHPRASGPGLPQAGPYRFDTKCNNDWSSRARLGETGDALVVSRGSTAGASPRRRPELIPRSRATLLKAARGGSARAPQSASGPFKIQVSILVRPMGRSRFLATRDNDATRDAQPDAPEGPASSARCRGCCRSSGGAPRAFIPAPPIAIRPTEPRMNSRGPPMTKPKPGLYPSIPPPTHRRPR